MQRCKKLRLQEHPDKNQDRKEEAQAAFIEVNKVLFPVSFE